jgi:cytochrome c oxidase subunit 4
MNHSTEHAAHHPATSVYYAIFAALLVLLAVTIGVAEIDLGRLNFPLAAAIATLKALLILLFFMHVRYAKPLIWLVAGAAFFWLAILFALTLSDYWTRGSSPPPIAPHEHTRGTSSTR